MATGTTKALSEVEVSEIAREADRITNVLAEMGERIGMLEVKFQPICSSVGPTCEATEKKQCESEFGSRLQNINENLTGFSERLLDLHHRCQL